MLVHPTLREWIARLWGTLRPGRADRDLEEELRLHLELAAEDEGARRRTGPPESAVRAAAIRTGGIAQTMEALRDQRGLPWIEDLVRDLRHGWRALMRSPGLCASGVLALGMGIGGPTVIYGILAGMLTPLPVADPHEVVAVSLLNPVRGDTESISRDVFAEWTRSATSFDTLGAYFSDESGVDGAGASPQRYMAAYVTAGVFEILGVRPVAGRGFAMDDVRAGAEATAVIREDVWEERFHRSPNALGSALRINGVVHTIIGVVPSDFGFPTDHRLWMAFPYGEGAPKSLSVLGRLKDGVHADAAAAELQSLLPGNEARGLAVLVDEYVRVLAGPKAQTMARYLYLLGTFLVFIAALNVAGLLLARGSARAADVALRLAIGGSRLRVMRHVLIEALLLAAGGTVVGLVLAQVALGWIEATLEARGGLPYWARIEVNGTLLVFATMLMVVATVVAGLVPAIRTSRVNLSQAIKPGAASASGGTGGTLPWLVGIEVALSCALLLMSALIVKGAVAQTARPTFPQQDVLTARLVLEDYDYPDAAARTGFRTELTRRLSSSPEIRDFTLTTTLPANGAPEVAFRLAGKAYESEREMPLVQQRRVLPSFFPMFGMRLVRGRVLTDADAAGGRPVLVVNEAFARIQFPDGNAVGGRLRLGIAGDAPDVEIVGVVADPGVTVDDGQRASSIFLPLDQGAPEALMIAMRVRAEPGGALAIMMREVAAVDPVLPLGRVQTLAEVIRRENDAGRIFGTLFSAFGAASLVLGVVGLHGLVAFAVSRRRREIGIMRALGAGSGGLLRATLARGLRPVAIGVVLGIGVAFVVAPLIGEGLFGTNPHDPVVFVLVPLGLIAAAAFAALGPATRAVRLDPMQALRSE